MDTASDSPARLGQFKNKGKDATVRILHAAYPHIVLAMTASRLAAIVLSRCDEYFQRHVLCESSPTCVMCLTITGIKETTNRSQCRTSKSQERRTDPEKAKC